MTETKSLTFKVEAQPESGLGRFSGIASTYGNVDQAGDVMIRGCFSRSIATKGTHFPLLWTHDMREVIGSFDVTSSEEALSIQGKFNMDVQRGREGYALLKAGDITGLSIGFNILDCDWDQDGHRLIKEADLWEVSLVAFPCNLQAMAEAKSMDMTTKLKAYDELDDETKKALRKLIKDALEDDKIDGESDGGTDDEESDKGSSKSDEDQEDQEMKAVRDIAAELKTLHKEMIT